LCESCMAVHCCSVCYCNMIRLARLTGDSFLSSLLLLLLLLLLTV